MGLRQPPAHRGMLFARTTPGSSMPPMSENPDVRRADA